jgi:stage V sporulation protein G
MSPPDVRPHVDDDSALAHVTVLRVERVRAGRLLALAEVEIVVDGVGISLHGVRVVKTAPRSRGVQAPAYRHDGVARPAVTLPPELARAVANAVLDEFDAMRFAAAPGAAGKGKGAAAAIIGPSAPKPRQRVS